MQEPEEKDETAIDSESQKKDDFKKQSGVEAPRMIGFIHEEVFGEEDDY